MGKVSSEKEGFPLALGIWGDSMSGVACDRAPQDRAGISCSHHYLRTHVKHSLTPKGKSHALISTLARGATLAYLLRSSLADIK